MNLTIDISNQVEIRNAITFLESLIEKPAPVLPKKLPKPPKGFIYAGMGPLKVEGRSRPNGYADVAMFTIRNEWDTTGWNGECDDRHYALRAGSEIAKLNGL